MKKLIGTLLCGMMAAGADAQVFPVTELKVSGAVERRINIVMLPDGFTEAQLPAFRANASSVRASMFNEAPLKNYANFYNVYSIDVPSAESGCDHPATATDVTEPASPLVSVNTYFSATFDGNFTHRALVCADVAAVDLVMAYNLPSYDQVILIANSTVYGGTGGRIATTSLHASANEIVRHELGHSFAGLADEYWAGTIFAREKPNMTAETDLASVKWANWNGVDRIGAYPYGPTDTPAMWFHPHDTCKMEVLGAPFCHVCQEAFIDKIYQVLSPVDSTYPEAASTSYSGGGPLPFLVKLIKPIPNTLKVGWQLNGTDLNLTDTAIVIPDDSLTAGVNTLRAYITDTTSLSRSFRPATGYQFAVTWYLRKGLVGLIDVEKAPGNTKFFYSIYPVPATDGMWLACDNQTGSTEANYTLTDAAGRVVARSSVALQQGKQRVRISTAGAVPGTYLLRVQGSGINVAEKVVVQ